MLSTHFYVFKRLIFIGKVFPKGNGTLIILKYLVLCNAKLLNKNVGPTTQKKHALVESTAVYEPEIAEI